MHKGIHWGILVVALMLAGCGDPRVTGNAEGGVMGMHGNGVRGVYTSAQFHCQKYDRDARVTQIMPGGSATFECVNN